MTPASSRWAISSGQRTEPGSQTRERSLRSRSTIITCSAASFAPSTSIPAGRVPLIGIVTSRRPRRARKSSGEAETIVQPAPANGRGCERAQRRERGGERRRVAGERRREVLDEIHLVDVAARDRGAHRLDRRGVALVVPAPLPLAELVARRCETRPGPAAGRIRQASSGSGHGSGGAGEPRPPERRREAVAEVEVGDDALAAPEALASRYSSSALERARPARAARAPSRA